MPKLNSLRVETILSTYPETRNNDELLHIRFLQEYYCETKKEKQIIEKVLTGATKGASLTRIRAYYQNDLEQYRANPEVQSLRKQKEKVIEDGFIKKKISKVFRILNK